jgi:hypothetical protein
MPMKSVSEFNGIFFFRWGYVDSYSKCNSTGLYSVGKLSSSNIARFIGYIIVFFEEWCLLGCYAVWLLVFLRSVRRLLVAACVAPGAPIFVTLM